MPKPVNTVLPVVSGILQVGKTLSSTNGTWTNSPTSFSYQWLYALTDDAGVVLTDDSGNPLGAVIIGATASTYVLVSADVGEILFIEVTATNAAGSDFADSLVTSSINVAPIPLDVTDTDFLEKPVDYFMPNLPQSYETYKDSQGTSRIFAVKVLARSRASMMRKKPTFTVRTDKKGHD